jgi:hypothetical protein
MILKEFQKYKMRLNCSNFFLKNRDCGSKKNPNSTNSGNYSNIYYILNWSSTEIFENWRMSFIFQNIWFNNLHETLEIPKLPKSMIGSKH